MSTIPLSPIACYFLLFCSHFLPVHKLPLLADGDYHLPSHLSPLARDLIARMLVVDPLSRMSIAEIRYVNQ
jgi:hypothetical protein